MYSNERQAVGDPTLATTEQNVLSLLIGEMEELETALHQGHTHNVVDKMGDVLCMASHADPMDQGQVLPTINRRQVASVFTSTQSARNLIHYLRTWRMSTIEAVSFRKLKKAVQNQMVHTSMSLCQHRTTWKAALTAQRIRQSGQTSQPALCGHTPLLTKC